MLEEEALLSEQEEWSRLPPWRVLKAVPCEGTLTHSFYFRS